MSSELHISKFSLHAIIGGVGPIDVMSFSSSFAVNTIPAAAISLAVGKDTKTFKDNLAGLNWESFQANYTKIEVYASAIGTRRNAHGGTSDWPSSAVRIFDGYIVNAAPVMQHGSYSLIVNAVHWLIDLDRAFWLFGCFAPQSAGSLLQPRFVGGDMMQPLMTVGNVPANSVTTALFTKRMQNSIDVDFWKLGWKQFILNVATQAPAAFQSISPYQAALNHLLPTAASVPSVLAENAIRRMDNTSHIQTVPTAFGSGTTLGTPAKNMMLNTLPALIWSSPSYTLWGKTLTFCELMSLSLIPNVESATIVPDCRYLDTPWRTLTEKDILSQNPGTAFGSPIRGVILVSAENSTTRLSFQPSNMPNVLGVYEDPTKHDGALDIQVAPQWMSHFDVPCTTVRTGKVSTPGKAMAAVSPSTGRGYTVGDHYAKHLYCSAMDRFTQVSYTLPLRMDICPGSTIAVRYDGVTFTSAANQLGAYATRGYVVSVTTEIVSKGAATTQLVVSHAVKAASPHLGQNPMYEAKWSGSKLAAW